MMSAQTTRSNVQSLLSLGTRILYSVKHRKSLNELPKLIEVVMSCSRAEHCDAAEQYLNLYVAKHITGMSNDGFARISWTIMSQLAQFINDTREHCEAGVHYPEYSEGKAVNTFPNMNNYAGRILDVQFKQVWAKGKSSIVGQKVVSCHRNKDAQKRRQDLQ